MHVLGRRNLLSGLGLGAGSQLLGSIFKALLPEAQGAAALRKRLIVFSTGNGFLERFWTCAPKSETDFDLASMPVFAPLAPYKENLVIASKFFNPFSQASHGNQMATLTVTESPVKLSQMRGPPGGISIDRLIAKSIGAADPFDSTAVGCVTYRQGGSPQTALCLSADGRNTPFPAIGSPTLAWRTFFGGGKGAGGMPAGDSLAQALAEDRSFLDLINEDVARMSARLAGPERARLDQYLDSLRGVEKSIALRASAELTCKNATPPAIDPAKGALDDNLDPDVLAAHIDLTFAAQQCGLTHVSHISIEGMEAPHVRYTWAPIGQTKNHHDDHHGFNYAVLQKIDTWWMSQVARMVDLLAKAPEGNGTMLDNTLVMFVNCCGGIHHRGHELHPLVFVAGKNVGMKGGRYLQYPQGQHCVSDAYISVANLFLDQPISTFGDPSVCKGPLPGLV
jgi:hypothetical protein